MYCAHQEWLIAPEIDIFWGEGDSLLFRVEIARYRPRAEVEEDSLRPSNQQDALDQTPFPDPISVGRMTRRKGVWHARLPGCLFAVFPKWRPAFAQQTIVQKNC